MEYSKERVIEWLNSKWKGEKICPICKNNNWSVSDTPVEIRPYHKGGMVIGGPVYPLFSLICNVCGNTLLFNALLAGLIEKEIPSSGATQPSEPKAGEKS